MSVLRHWKIVVALTGLFIVGVVTGSVMTVKVIKFFVAKNARENIEWPQTTFRDYQKRLKLTPEQQEKLRPVFMEAGSELRAIRRDAGLVYWRLNRDVEKELTPEQQKEFEKIREELRAKFEERKKGGKN